MLENIGINTNTAKLRVITCSHDICHTCLLVTKKEVKTVHFIKNILEFVVIVYGGILDKNEYFKTFYIILQYQFLYTYTNIYD